MSKRPVLLLAAMFCVGILSGEVKSAIVFAGFLLIYAKPWKEKGTRKAVFAAGLPLLFFLGMFCMCRENTFRQNYLDRMQDEQQVRLAGRVTRIEEKTRCFYYYLTDCTISLSEQHMQTNDVIAYVSSDEYSIGQILTVEGTISLFDVATNEGAFDARQFYRSQKIDFGIWVERVIAVRGKPDRYRMFLENIRQRLKNNIESCMKDGGVLSAMILGEKSGLDAEVKSLYQKAGISHILAISGLHVSFLGMGMYRILRHRLRRTYWMSATITAAVMLSYAIMTGNGVSTLRAVGMLCIYLIADILGQNYDMLSALGAMILVLLWKNPFLIGYSGFVFSVAAVLGVGAGQEVILKYAKVCAGKQKEETQAENVLKQKWKEQREGLWISLSIQLFTLPLVAYHYYEIPVYAMILNLFVLALVKYLMELGVLGAVSGLLSCGIAKWILVPCGWILWGYEKLCRLFVGFPGAQYITGKPDMWQMITYYTGLAVILFMLYRKVQLAEVQLAKEQYGKQRLTGAVYIFVPLAMLFLVLIWPQKKSFEIDFLDVGQGDGIYLCTGDGVAMFVDGGSTDVKNVGQYRILPFLKAKGIRKISCWFVSHTDADHISGLEEVLASGYPVERLLFAEAVKGKEKTKSLAKLAEKAGTVVQYMEADETLYSKNTAIRCLYPQAMVQSEDINEQCLVLCYEEGDVKALFAGDISSEIEKKILERKRIEHVQIYKANHHGSRFSNGEEWMQVLHPQITVASAGKNNRYGHPSVEACDRIRASGSTFYCTTEYGRIRVRIVDGKLVCAGYVTAP